MSSQGGHSLHGEYMLKDSYNTLIIGAGLSGLSLAHFLKKQNPDLTLAILEKGDRPGGAIRSFHENGYLAEWGAHGFLDNCKESRELLAGTGLDKEIQKAPLGKFVRYICLNGKLRLIPQSLRKILASNIVPLSTKLRVLADLWKKPRVDEQSIAAWTEHRFGRSLLPFIDAALTGTSAGDMERLSIDAVMPGVRQLELKHGSVIRGLIKKQIAQKKATAGRKEKRHPLSMVSFPSGMERLTSGVAEGFKENEEIFFNTQVIKIGRKKETWTVTADDVDISCRNLVMALPVNSSLDLLASEPNLQSPPFEQIPETRIANVVLGFTDKTKIPFGFGYLAPEQEQRFALGAMFSSHMFPGRAPEGHVLLEALVGGRRHPERLELEDEAMITAVLEDLGELLPLEEKPCFTRVLRQKAAFPQLEMGYPKLLAWRNTLAADNPGLHICGFGWEGIGINDMIKQAHRIARGISAGINASQEEAEVKGVYF